MTPAVLGRAPDGDASGVPVALGELAVLGIADTWIIPSALFGIPGLALILVVLLETGAAAAWIPAIRRLRGEDVEGSVAA